MRRRPRRTGQQSLLRVLGVLVAVLLPAGTIVYLFLFKMMSFMQSRLGPMEAGPVRLDAAVRRGRQVAAEGGHRPRAAPTRGIFKLAPLIVLRRTFLLVRRSCRSGPTPCFANFDAGIFYALAVSSISRARHPHRRLGVGQQVLAARRPAGRRPADRLRAADGARRRRRRHPGRHAEPAAASSSPRTTARSSAGTASATRTSSPSSSASCIFMIAVQAELTQTPFDMPIAESELVAGLHDRVLRLPLPASSSSPSSPPPACSPLIAATLFLGGWGVPFSWFGWTRSTTSPTG